MRVLGLMSGTSADGVDAAVADIGMRGDTLRLTPGGAISLPWPGGLRERILAAVTPGAGEPGPTAGEICRLDRDLGRALGEVAAQAVARLGPVDVVCSHGQTIHHAVDAAGRVAGTLQVGQPAEIAERTGLPVVADLRTRDVAAGGQGAPLVSILDDLLLRGAAGSAPVAALNLGGIANLTVVRPDAPTLAFDCGPGNALLDLAVARATGQPYDPHGARAARGTLDEGLLAVLLADGYLTRSPPKSTGRERYDAGYLDAALTQAPVARLEDLLATLAEATAAAVAADVARYGARQVWASGGGVHHPGVMAALRRRLAPTATLSTTAALGLPVDHKEAYAFAVLGWLTWHGLPGTLPGCTGAAGPRILGTIAPGAGALRLPPPRQEPPRRAVVGE